MKLHANNTQQYQTITAYEADAIEINAKWVRHSFYVMPEQAPQPWLVGQFEQLQADDFDAIQALQPDVVILGTGTRQRFIHPKLVSKLTSQRIGVESMDNQAACRTYNILMAEGRRVVLALILEQHDAKA